jgi:hypothetical protein
MSTDIKTIQGTWHKKVNSDYSVEHGDAEISLTRFFAGTDKGANIQVTIQQQGIGGETSYIHLTNEQCKDLGHTLLECFDRNKYPSD